MRDKPRPAVARITASHPPDRNLSVIRALEILAVVGAAACPGISVRSIAENRGLTLPTTYRYVRTLAYHGYLQRWHSTVAATSAKPQRTGRGRAGETYTLGFAVLDRATDLSRLLAEFDQRRSAGEIAEAVGQPPEETGRYLKQATRITTDLDRQCSQTSAVGW